VYKERVFLAWKLTNFFRSFKQELSQSVKLSRGANQILFRFDFFILNTLTTTTKKSASG